MAWSGLGLVACAGDQVDVNHQKLRDEVTKLDRNVQALKEAVAQTDAGRFIESDDIIIGIEERAVTQLLEAALPAELTIKGLPIIGPVHIRIDRASVLFDGGFGTVAVNGQASFKSIGVMADVHVSGGFAKAQMDRNKRLLTAEISIDTLDAKVISQGLLSRLLRGALLRRLDEFGKDAITRALVPLELPVRIEQDVHVPKLDEDPVHLEGGTLPVTVSFTCMFASHGRLWLGVKPQLGTWRKSERH